MFCEVWNFETSLYGTWFASPPEQSYYSTMLRLSGPLWVPVTAVNPLTKGQLCGKQFYIMIFSCYCYHRSHCFHKHIYVRYYVIYAHLQMCVFYFIKLRNHINHINLEPITRKQMKLDPLLIKVRLRLLSNAKWMSEILFSGYNKKCYYLRWQTKCNSIEIICCYPFPAFISTGWDTGQLLGELHN